MATFLSLTNELLLSTGDTVLSEAEFLLARNVQAAAKNAVNNSIQYITQKPYEWPWNHSVQTVTLLTDGTREYALPTNTLSVDWDSFKILPNTGSDIAARRLEYLDLDEYRRWHEEVDLERTSTSYNTPQRVYRTQNQKFGVTPTPDKAYQVSYELWTSPTDLVAPTDVCSIPDQLRHVVLDGAKMYMADFRSNNESCQYYEQKLERGIKLMRDLYISRASYVRSTMLPSTSGVSSRYSGG